jgi:hypothetical protein
MIAFEGMLWLRRGETWTRYLIRKDHADITTYEELLRTVPTEREPGTWDVLGQHLEIVEEE